MTLKTGQQGTIEEGFLKLLLKIKRLQIASQPRKKRHTGSDKYAYFKVEALNTVISENADKTGLLVDETSSIITVGDKTFHESQLLVIDIDTGYSKTYTGYGWIAPQRIMSEMQAGSSAQTFAKKNAMLSLLNITDKKDDLDSNQSEVRDSLLVNYNSKQKNILDNALRDNNSLAVKILQMQCNDESEWEELCNSGQYAIKKEFKARVVSLASIGNSLYNQMINLIEQGNYGGYLIYSRLNNVFKASELKQLIGEDFFAKMRVVYTDHQNQQKENNNV